MAFRRCVVSLESLDDARTDFEPGDLLDVVNGDAAMVLAALGVTSDVEFGLWLRVDDDRPAALAARDLATLSHLVRFGLVVVAASVESAAQADVVRALLSADEVNFSNEVTTLRGAYNRPAPAWPLDVASSDGASIVRGNERYTLRAREARPWGEVVLYGP